MRATLRTLGESARRERGLLALRRLSDLDEIGRVANLLLYRSLSTEVCTEAVFAEVHARGQTVFSPAIEGSDLVFRVVTANTSWCRNPLGFLEPDPSNARLTEEDVAKGSTVALVPGLAFTERGDRLGRGGGHYDRVLARAPLAGAVLAIGLAFDLQVVRSIPVADHDRRVDLLVTESRTIRTAARR